MSIYKPHDDPDYRPDFRDVRERRDSEELWTKNQRGHRWIGLSILFVAVVCAAMAWVAYPMLQEHQGAVSKLPEIQGTLDALGKQAAAADSNLSDWATRQEELRAQVNKTLDGLRTRIAASSKQAQEAAGALWSKAQAEFANQVDELKTRIAGVERSRETDRASLDALQKELSQTKNELVAETQQLNALRGDVERQAKQSADQIASTQNQVASMGQRQVRDRTDFDALAQNVARRRIDFEVQKNHSVDVLPGIAIAIHKTNVSYQRASGWVSAPDKRTIWLRDLRTQEPVVLVNSSDGRQEELVLTHVSENSVVGYIVLPADRVRGS